jgi:two-component system response regulator AtoC
VPDLENAREVWKVFKPDVVLLDVMLPDGNGIDMLSEAKQKNLSGLVIIVTASGDLEKATEAMRIGAYDYLTKPLDLDQLEAVLVRAKQSISVQPEPTVSINESDEYIPGRITGKSQAVLELHKQIGLASRSYANVLIRGESGAGKELVAKSIHRNSGYQGPFVAVNCSAIVPTLAESELFGHEKGAFTGAVNTKTGQLELAKDGTIFLDEIGDLSLELQVKLLRTVQEREFSRVGGMRSIKLQARLIAATHRNLEEMVKKGDFREDLYYRLKVLEVHVPALRERKEDIPLLVKTLLKKINIETHRAVTRVPQKILKALMEYPWHGNVRELENRLIAAVIHSPGDVLEMDLPQMEPESKDQVEVDTWKRPLADVEKDHIQRVLDRVDGHFGKACEILGISRPTLRKKIQDYDLKIPFN